VIPNFILESLSQELWLWHEDKTGLSAGPAHFLSPSPSYISIVKEAEYFIFVALL
jgi:hypothetical protein